VLKLGSSSTRMFRALRTTALAIAGTITIHGAAQAAPAPLTAEQAAFDARVLKRALAELHPALTKYRTRAEIDAALARFEARATAARDVGQVYLAATEMAAAIRCGHTWTNTLNQTGAARAALLDAADKLPLTLTWVEDRWLVLASAAPGVSRGDEMLSIDGVPARQMVARLMPYLRADDASDGKRWRQLGHDRFDHSAMDTVWPLLAPPVDGHYRLEVRDATGATRTLRVPALTLEAPEQALAAQGVAPMNDRWSLRIEGGLAVMTLPTFSFWSSDFDWARFIDDGFAELARRGVKDLVIDIRDNEGGDDAIGKKLLSHLLRRPFTFTASASVSAYERVPYILARYLDTWDFGFFDRTGQVEKIERGTAAGQYRVTAQAAQAQTIEPVASPYPGRVFVLVGGENSSATYQFARLVQQSRAAVLVGQATGGNRRGLNGGQLAWVTLPNSGVAVDIPLLAAAYDADTPDASVTPDIVVARTFDARRAGRDQEMEAVRREVASRSTR